jgi:hypothetical protein
MNEEARSFGTNSSHVDRMPRSLPSLQTVAGVRQEAEAMAFFHAFDWENEMQLLSAVAKHRSERHAVRAVSRGLDVVRPSARGLPLTTALSR